MKKSIMKVIVCVGLMVVGAFSYADSAQTPPNPIPELQSVSDHMIAALKKNKASMKKNPAEVSDIVRTTLLPHVDLIIMSRSALGRDAWMAATHAQQQAFTGQFVNLVINTYASALSSFNDDKVVFDAIRGGIPAGAKRVEVNSQIMRKDGPPVNVSYRLIYESKENTWKVYDFSVEGISMVASFQSQFASDLATGIGIEGLTKKLALHNANNTVN
jgi:phospholipid transport system substrate-binding protein